ncbi:solute carrier family 12 member 8 [Culicoides brevitarsis]|uniref:solute carrier family 12 member 8 n=1 Tax=Culicoides brevitarsis TaxID=469753 RepID=UPI00307B7094
MPRNNRNAQNNEINYSRYGIDDEPTSRQATGFVDLDYANECDYTHPSAPNEIYQTGEKPWWRSNFFISQPVLFGTWDGVFTSCLINIFGVIVFLRSGWMVAQAGIIASLLIIFCSVIIGLISVLSAIGIVERCRVESGGVYFLISHTMGSRIAGSFGLLYCFGQAVGCALNVLGFGESLAELLGLKNVWMIRFLAACAVLVLAVINVAGVKWVVKLQFALLIVLLLSALDFMVGTFVKTDPEHGIDGWGEGNFMENIWSKYQDGYDWFRVFGVFFPTITGVLAGINMSGDLRTPSSDIPNGTLAAFSTATFLYMTFILFLGAICTRETLLTDFSIAAKASAVSVLLLAGVYVSSMSSCLGAMYGTPRVLQSIALENVIPRMNILGTGRGANKIPIYAMGVVATITITFIFIGDINTLAPIVTMPFLLTYACIDYSYFALAQTFDIQVNREERYRVQAHSPSYGATNAYTDDLDHLFPERTQHKSLHQSTSSHNVNSEATNGTNSTVQTPQGEETTASVTDTASINAADDEPIAAPNRPTIHSKTQNWYSGFCNRYASLLGALIKILVMFLVNWIYAIFCISIVFIVWYYIGTANPAVKPGLAHEFRLFVWLKNSLFQCFGKNRDQAITAIITPSCTMDLSQQQINDENDDFSSRRRYHHTSNVQGHYVVDA